MARDLFIQSFTYVDVVSGSLKPLNNAQVTVYNAGTAIKASLYVSRDPQNAAQMGNPLLTEATGGVEFWLAPGEYDIVVADLNAPARIGTKTIGYNALSAAPAGIPSSRIAADGGLSFGSLGAAAQRQVMPIGGVIDWWRPSSAVPVPTGWAVCDGSLVAANLHEFPGVATSINLPDLRNKMVLGANIAKTDGSSATDASDTSGGAPGIGGTGGSNLRNMSHSHDMGNHTHTIAHTHNHSHTHTMPHTHSMAHTHDLQNHTHTIAHTHSLNNHTHGMGNHEHYIDHRHAMPHTHSLMNHTHNLGTHTHGIVIEAGEHHDHTTATASRGTAGGSANGGGENVAYTNHVHVVNGAGHHSHGATMTGPTGESGLPSENITGPASGTLTATANLEFSHGPVNPSTHAAMNNTEGPSTNATGASSAANSGLPSENSTGNSSAANTGVASNATTATQSDATTSGSSAANSGAPSSNATGAALAATMDIKPQYVGLLKLMKIRRA